MVVERPYKKTSMTNGMVDAALEGSQIKETVMKGLPQRAVRRTFVSKTIKCSSEFTRRKTIQKD